jgi:hypothetical protein
MMVKDIRTEVLAEVGPNQFLVYSFTHDTFAIFDLATYNIAPCDIPSITEDHICHEVRVSDPPTHLWYTNADQEVFGRPLSIVVNKRSRP